MSKEKLIQYRTIEVRAEDIDEDERTLPLTFSSESPVERWWGTEVLDHARGSVRLGRLKGGGPLLMEHDTRQHVGVIESAKIADRKGEAVVRFGRHDLGVEALKMVQDGIKRSISVGYLVHKIERSEDLDAGVEVMRVTDWEPLEVSLVAIPADPSVGVGRELRHYAVEIVQPHEDLQMPDQHDIDVTPGSPSTDNPVIVTADNTRSGFDLLDVDLIKDQAGEKAQLVERKRVKAINSAANLYPKNARLRDLADDAIEQGFTLEDFQSRAIPLIGNAEPLEGDGDPKTALGMSGREVQQFSVLRAIDAIVQQQSGGRHWSELAGFEHECSRAVEDALDRESKGFFVPHDVQRGGSWMSPHRVALMRRMMGIRAAPMDTTENVDLVPTLHDAANYIEALRATSVVLMSGARMLGGLTGNVDIPRTDTPAVFGWIAEDADSADTEIVTGTVSLSPKTVSGSVPITRRLRKQASPDVELLVREDLVEGAALAVDLGMLSGTGAAGQPTGVTVIAGTGTSTIASAGVPTWIEFVEFETDVAEANGLRGSLATITTASVRGAMKTTSKAGTEAIFISDGATANGYPVTVSTQLAANTIIFGNWAEVLLGMWGVLDIRIDTATNAQKDRTTIRAFQDVDVGIRHAASFSKNA